MEVRLGQLKRNMLPGLERNDARMVRWVYNVKSEDKISVEELCIRLKLNSMKECLEDRLPWFGHLERMKEGNFGENCSVCPIRNILKNSFSFQSE